MLSYNWPRYFKAYLRENELETGALKIAITFLSIWLAKRHETPPWRNIRNFQHFSSTKEQNLQKKFTLSHLRAWNNVHTDMFYNLQKDWLANCLSGSLQFAVVRFAIHRLTFSNHSPVWNCHDVSRRFSKFLCGSANVSKLRCIVRQKTVLTSNGFCDIDIFQ